MITFPIFRCLEVKHELVSLVFSEYTYLTEAIQQIGITPYEVEIQIPNCYKRERRTDIEWKRKFINDTLRKIGMFDEVKPGNNIQVIRIALFLFFRILKNEKEFKFYSY